MNKILDTALLLAVIAVCSFLLLWCPESKQVTRRYPFPQGAPAPATQPTPQPVKQCDPPCVLPLRCNSRTGTCEAPAAAQKPQSEVLLIGLDYGKPDPGEVPTERLMVP